MTFQNLASGQVSIEPAASVYLREFLHFARSTRPFHGKGNTLDRGRIQIKLHCPRVDDFPAFLPDRLQGSEFSLRDSCPSSVGQGGSAGIGLPSLRRKQNPVWLRAHCPQTVRPAGSALGGLSRRTRGHGIGRSGAVRSSRRIPRAARPVGDATNASPFFGLAR